MRHIESINEWLGKKEGDDFAEKLLDIVEKEKIKIVTGAIGPKVIVDGIEYHFTTELFILGLDKHHIEIYKNGNFDNKIEISTKYYRRIKKMLKTSIKDDRLNRLPDISEFGRDTKKYNL